jgi:hypothetical protein
VLFVALGREQPRTARPAPATTTPAEAPRDVPAPAGPRVSEVPGLRLHAAEGARWDLVSDANENRLTLASGSIWISYDRATARRVLVVEAPGVVVTVRGTILFVSATQAGVDVGVLVGAVSVRREVEGETIVRAGLVLSPSGALRPVAPAERVPATEWLQGSRPAAARAPQPAAPASPAPAPPGPEDAYRDAESALSSGDARRAETVLTALVLAWPASPQAVTARLELARLYARPLGRPDLAVESLRAYLAASPAGPAAEAARAEVCRLLPRARRDIEPVCAASASP